MARGKGVKRLKDEPGFNGAIGESTFNLAKTSTSSLQAKPYKKNYALRGWRTEASLLLVRGFQRSSDVPKIRTRFEKNNQLEP